MTIYSSYQMAALLTFVSTAVLAVFVLIKGASRMTTRLFGIYTLAISSWSFGWFMMISSSTATVGLFWIRLLHCVASFIPATFLHFVQHFLNIDKNRKQIMLKRVFYGFGILFCVATPISSYIKAAVPKPGFPLYIDPGPVYITFVIFFVIAVVTTCSLLFSAYRSAPSDKKSQIGSVFAAYVMAYLGGTPAFLPAYGYPMPSLVLYLIPTSHIIIAYAIFAHRLMDIQVVIRRTLIYSFITAGLAAVYAGTVTLLARLMESPADLLSLSPVALFNWLGRDLKLSYAYSCVLTALFSACFGGFVWIKGRNKPLNILWSLFCLSIALWSLGEGLHVRALTIEDCLFWAKFGNSGAILIVAFFLHFVFKLVQETGKRVLIASYSWVALCQILFWTIPMFIVKPMGPFNFYGSPGENYWTFTAYFIGVVIYAHYLLLRKMRTAEGQINNQIMYVFMGTAIGFVGGATTLLFTYGLIPFPYGVYVIPAYILIVGYAIFKHQLMDIRMVIRKTLLYSLVSAALISVYVGTITLAAQSWGGRHGPTSVFSSALAAIFITLLFNPLRLYTQRWIDRHFPRETLDPVLLQEAAGGFAHEMKRPLSKISLPAELMLRELGRVKSGEQSWQEYLPALEEKLRFIIGQSAEAGYMIEAIRELSATAALPFEPVNLESAIKTALLVENDLLERRGVTTVLNFPHSLPSVSGRAKQLEIVFVNLIKNAAEAMSDLPAGQARNLTIEGESLRASVVIRFEDSGSGIKPGDLPKVFQPNYSTKGAKGTGMGLYLSQQIVVAHGGTIEVSSQSGQGTTFGVRLPAKRSQ